MLVTILLALVATSPPIPPVQSDAVQRYRLELSVRSEVDLAAGLKVSGSGTDNYCVLTIGLYLGGTRTTTQRSVVALSAAGVESGCCPPPSWW